MTNGATELRQRINTLLPFAAAVLCFGFLLGISLVRVASSLSVLMGEQ